MATGFIEALAAAAVQLREEKGVTREEIAVSLGRSVDKVRYFEGAKGFAGLNDMIDAYEANGISLFDLLDEAKATLKKSG
jgi:predicted transcriptional regulator